MQKQKAAGMVPEGGATDEGKVDLDNDEDEVIIDQQ